MDYYRTCESCKCYGTPTCGRCFMWSMYKPIMECVRVRNNRRKDVKDDTVQGEREEVWK